MIIIDAQEKLMSKMVRRGEVVGNIAKLIKFAEIAGIPVILTEQYPKGLGRTIDDLRELIPDLKPIEKVSFNCFLSEEFRRRLKENGATTLILVGIEAHICVTQTALQGLNKFRVYVIVDATSSRTEKDLTTAIERMRHEGVVMASTEMAIYEMLEKAGTDEFKEVLGIIKQETPRPSNAPEKSPRMRRRNTIARSATYRPGKSLTSEKTTPKENRRR